MKDLDKGKIMIKSILDQDFYKVLMQQVVFFRFPLLNVEYKFIDRNDTIYPIGFTQKLREEVDKMASLKLTNEEKEWLSKLPGINKYYLDWLFEYKFNPKEVTISEDCNNRLSIRVEGLWLSTILWEVPLLALISELYYKETGCKFNQTDFAKKTIAKKQSLTFPFADFGTRRRFLFDSQDLLVAIMKNTKVSDENYFLGTSNMYLAMKYNCAPIGTTAHECVMAMSALYGVENANSKWFDNWRHVYGNLYNVALIDTYTTNFFFKTMSRNDLLLIDGLRQDSGDPVEIGNKIIREWKESGINSKDKKIVFSDNLNVETATKIYSEFKDKTNVVFGIGTFLTNDCGYKPMNIVIKLDGVFDFEKWVPVVKLSDSEGKYCGNNEEVKRVLEEIK